MKSFVQDDQFEESNFPNDVLKEMDGILLDDSRLRRKSHKKKHKYKKIT